MVVVNKGAWVNECYVGEGGFVSWVETFMRTLRHHEKAEYEAMLSFLANFFICRVSMDCRIRKATPSSTFSSKSFMKELKDIPSVRPPSSLVWMGLAHPRGEAFCRLVISGKASNIDNLSRRGFVLESSLEACVLCRREKGNINHLFVHCQ